MKAFQTMTIQQLRCNICFPYVFLLALIEDKTKGGKKSLHTYKKSFGTTLMKWHVEYVHAKLLVGYVAEIFTIEGIGGS
jgi:hypothetical protein